MLDWLDDRIPPRSPTFGPQSNKGTIPRDGGRQSFTNGDSGLYALDRCSVPHTIP